MQIGGITKSSLIDYPKKISAVIFLIGCNFNCPYCHNPELVISNIIEPIDINSIYSFLKKRKGLLDGVVITGGEPTLHKKLPEFIKNIKDMGYLIKLDTNGSNPNMVEELIENKLVDYIAMDIKAPFDEYNNIITKEINIENVKKTFKLLVQNKVDYEFRTTVVSNLLNYESFVKINEIFKKEGKIKKYCLQRFKKSKHLNEFYLNAKTLTDEEFEKVSLLFKNTIEEFMVRWRWKTNLNP